MAIVAIKYALKNIEEEAKSMVMEERIKQILSFNENLAFSLLEIVGKFPFPKLLKVMWSLARLERAGLIESKRIGFKKYFHVKK